MQKGVRIVSLFVLLALGFFISANFVSAYTANYTCNIVLAQNCNASVGGNIIVGLASQSNSHAEYYGAPYNSYSTTNPDPLYPYAVCCYFGNGNQTCSLNPPYNSVYGSPVPQNEIIRLSSSTNAHSETPAPPIYYSTPVCYWYNSNGPVECITTTPVGTGCPQQYPIDVLNLSGYTNAHIGTGSGFNIPVCCGIVGTSYGQLNCNLTSATWIYTSTMQGVQAGLNITGTNCAGASITFNVTDSNNNKVYNNPSDVTFPVNGGNSVLSLWTAEFHTGQPNNYKFTAIAIFNGNNITSGTGTGSNASLSVSQQPAGYCTSINTCADYNSSSTCASDTSLCSVAKNDPNKDPNAAYYLCAWNTTSSTCNFENYYQGSGSISCGTGYTLCTNITNGLSYCYPGNLCPLGETPLSNGNGKCDGTEGCSSVDCKTGDLSNCKLSLCSAGMCYNSTANPVNITQCGNGYSLCYNSLKGLTYCYPNNVCPSGDTFTNNSCANTSLYLPPFNMNNQNPGSCLGDSVCQSAGVGGVCASPTAATGKCVYAFQGANGGCSNGLMTYSWTATWTGTGNQPANCKSGQSVIECPAQIPLPLFTPLNGAITIVVIIGIYLAIHFMRKSKKKIPVKKRKQSKKEEPKKASKKKK